jgi:hypothetical protein
MNSTPSNRIPAVSALLILPALCLCTCGVLLTVFGVTSANSLLDSILATAVGRMFLSPVAVLGGVLTSLALNLWALCRVRVGLDTGTLYVTFYIARALPNLILAAFSMMLTTLLLLYAFAENFRVIQR